MTNTQNYSTQHKAPQPPQTATKLPQNHRAPPSLLPNLPLPLLPTSIFRREDFMAKSSKRNNNNNDDDNNNNSRILKVKRTRKSVPRESPQRRSSIYRGVTRHRWTGRFEAHLWDKNCWNESQSKKGRQVYLGAYEDEEAAAHAYDLAALKYWGQDTILNFPLSTYQNELSEMEAQSKEEYIGSLRRRSSGFSRGVSKYRGVARHHHNGRWEARIGRVFGNKYLYLGTYATQEEAAIAYDMAAIEYRGLNAVTNFDLSRYIKWLQPFQNNENSQSIPKSETDNNTLKTPDELPFHNHQHHPSIVESTTSPPCSDGGTTSSSTLGLLLQSSKLKEILEQTTTSCNDPSSPSRSDPPRSSFPDDIQTSFDFQDSSNFAEEHNVIFGNYDTFLSSIFQYDAEIGVIQANQ